MGTILKKIERGSEFNGYEKNLFSKFSQGNGGSGKIYMNNPQIILWDAKYEALVKKINEIRGVKNDEEGE